MIIIEAIIKKLIENHRIDEMAVSRGEAIVACMELGEIFIEHFHKVYIGGSEDIDFHHHCQEMQAWYNKAHSIKLKTTKKNITFNNLIDWFFTACKELTDYFDDPDEISTYESMISELEQSPDSPILDIVASLL